MQEISSCSNGTDSLTPTEPVNVALLIGAPVTNAPVSSRKTSPTFAMTSILLLENDESSEADVERILNA